MTNNWILNPYGLKPWFTRRLKSFVFWAVKHKISPDLFTLIGVLGALLGAVVLASPAFQLELPWWLFGLLVLFFGFIVRLAGANLDGAVARARGVSRPEGFILNELGDRVSDMLLFLGLIIGVPDSWKIPVVIVALLSSLPTLISISGAAVGTTRLNGGPFGKTERTFVFVILGTLLARELTDGNAIAFGLMLMLMSLGALATSLKRFKRIRRLLSENGTEWVDDQPTVIEGNK